MTTQSTIENQVMDEKEAMIEALQNRVKYLEANLHLALQVLNNLEEDALDYAPAHSCNSSLSISSEVDSYSQGQTIEVVPTDKVALPTFLNARTWKQQNPHHLMIKAS